MSPLYPTTIITSSTTGGSESKILSNNLVLPTFRSGFGISWVSSRILDPLPAAKMTAFISFGKNHVYGSLSYESPHHAILQRAAVIKSRPQAIQHEESHRRCILNLYTRSVNEAEPDSGLASPPPVRQDIAQVHRGDQSELCTHRTQSLAIQVLSVASLGRPEGALYSSQRAL